MAKFIPKDNNDTSSPIGKIYGLADNGGQVLTGGIRVLNKDAAEAFNEMKEIWTKSVEDGTIVNFYDWDNTVIGQIYVPPTIKDARSVINAYVLNNLIHPDLRGNTNYSSTARADNYRGEYPYTGPDENDPLRTGGENTVEDGADYPLTNHLDYGLYGKDIDPDYPYVNCWAVVTEENMEDTFTALYKNQTPEDAGLTMADFTNFSGGGMKTQS